MLLRKKIRRPIVILIKFYEEESPTENRKQQIYEFFGSNNIVEPQPLDGLTFKALWVNPHFPPKSINAERLNKSEQWEAGKVFYAYSYLE